MYEQQNILGSKKYLGDFNNLSNISGGNNLESDKKHYLTGG